MGYDASLTCYSKKDYSFGDQVELDKYCTVVHLIQKYHPAFTAYGMVPLSDACVNNIMEECNIAVQDRSIESLSDPESPVWTHDADDEEATSYCYMRGVDSCVEIVALIKKYPTNEYQYYYRGS